MSKSINQLQRRYQNRHSIPMFKLRHPVYQGFLLQGFIQYYIGFLYNGSNTKMFWIFFRSKKSLFSTIHSYKFLIRKTLYAMITRKLRNKKSTSNSNGIPIGNPNLNRRKRLIRHGIIKVTVF